MIVDESVIEKCNQVSLGLLEVLNIGYVIPEPDLLPESQDLLPSLVNIPTTPHPINQHVSPT
jgi:hypothetical protein